MKITRSSDWRDALAFDVPVRADTVLPGDDARCAVCGPASQPLPRTRLWALKQRHPHDPAGTVRLVCDAHRRVTSAPVIATTARPSMPTRRPGSRTTPRTSTRSSTRRPAHPERVAAVCPDCFVEVPPTGVCGMCGRRVA